MMAQGLFLRSSPAVRGQAQDRPTERCAGAVKKGGQSP